VDHLDVILWTTTVPQYPRSPNTRREHRDQEFRRFGHNRLRSTRQWVSGSWRWRSKQAASDRATTMVCGADAWPTGFGGRGELFSTPHRPTGMGGNPNSSSAAPGTRHRSEDHPGQQSRNLAPEGRRLPCGDISPAAITARGRVSLRRSEPTTSMCVLLHWPERGRGGRRRACGARPAGQSGKARFVGVSNFTA